jgi:hypothetical protein
LFWNSCSEEKKPQQHPASVTTQVTAVSAEVVSDQPFDLNDPKMEERGPAPLEIPGGLERDLGPIWEFGMLHFAIPLRNPSDQPWTLATIDASCSCTSVDGIPSGVEIPAHGEWIMQVRVDASRLSVGPFEREIILFPEKYRPVRLKFRGVVKQFVRITPVERVLRFPSINDPREPWEMKAVIKGIEEAKDKLDIELVENPKSWFQVQLTKQSPGVWHLLVKPKGTLPYADSLAEAIRFRCLAPAGLPEFTVGVSGRVGMTMRFEPMRLRVEEKDFDEKGVVRVSSMIGYDPVRLRPKMQRRRIENIVAYVDWKVFYENCSFEAPPGVKVTKEFTKYGVLVNVEAQKSAFDSKKRVEVHLSVFGIPQKKLIIFLGPPRKKADESEKKTE